MPCEDFMTIFRKEDKKRSIIKIKLDLNNKLNISKYLLIFYKYANNNMLRTWHTSHFGSLEPRLTTVVLIIFVGINFCRFSNMFKDMQIGRQ